MPPMLAALAAALLASSVSCAASSFYVDCAHGSDASGQGTASAPWASLARAQTAVRAALPAPPPGITVYLQGDCVARDAAGLFSNATQLLLTAADSGSSADAPVTWAAWPGAAAAPRLLGGVAVPPAAWAPAPTGCPAAPGTLVADLGASGLDVARFGFGALASGGLGSCVDTAMELFVDGVPQWLARYPNISPEGTWEWIEINRVDSATSQYEINGTAAARALTWPTASSPGASAWVHGYWSFDWADSYCEVTNVTSDGAGGAIINIEPNTPPVYGFLPKARFYGVNILSELDAPGEYYIDVGAERLFWMPPAGGVDATAEVVLSVAQSLVGTAPGESVANVAFSGLGLYYARGVALTLSGANASVVGCTSALHGQSGLALQGSAMLLRDSTVFGTGCRATSMGGGDLATLTPSGNVVANNTVHSFARITRTYEPGIAFGDCGGLYANNTISNGPHTGVTGGGALNTFVGNVFDSLLFEASDAGAFYVGYSWTNRGNVLRNNTFRRIRATEKTFLGYPSVQAIYLDDEQSGYTIEDNVCEDSMTCYFVGGGRDNIIRNNVCRNVGTCLHLDNRGLNWQHDSCTVNATWTGRLVQELLDVHYQQPPYSTAFPEIVTTLDRRPCTPVNNSFVNTFACNTSVYMDASLADLAAWGDVFANNTNASVC